MKLSELPDVNFIDTDLDTVETEIFSTYKKITGRTLAQGDPIRLFLLVITNVIVILLNQINETGKQNLLKYATGAKLDNIGALLGVYRSTESAAKTTVRITLSAVRESSTTINSSTRITAGDNVYFATDDVAVISAGQISTDISATCTVAGTIGNGYKIGELNMIVDPQPYVATITNTTETEGGSDAETDDAYREVVHEAPEKFSTAGPDGAYKYWGKRASSNISDIYVCSPEPGVVNVYPLLSGGNIPGNEMLKIVSDVLTADKVRPLTDKVQVLAPTVVNYNINLDYYLDDDHRSQAADITTAIDAAINNYTAWQREKLGRDINPSKLISLIMDAGAKRVEVKSPVFSSLKNGEIAIINQIQANYLGVEDD